MIISQTPFRISLFGGGTDYPEWYREHGGAVLSTTIDKYCYISCRYLPPFFEHKHRIVYSIIESVQSIPEIQHPAVRAIMTYLGVNRGLEIHHDGDLPARAGIGSSSAFCVGLVHTLRALRGELISRSELAKEAIHIERNVIAEVVGSQDQVASAFGGFNRIDFYKDDTFNVAPVVLSQTRKAELDKHLMLFFTGFQRHAPDIARMKVDNFKNKKKELSTIKEMVDEAISCLTSQTEPIESLGKLLDEGWQLKRGLADCVTTAQLDEIYNAAQSAGATGGKLLGAGGGGFFLFFVKPELQDRVREKLKNLVCVSFHFINHGSKIVFYDPNL